MRLSRCDINHLWPRPENNKIRNKAIISVSSISPHFFLAENTISDLL